ncbi:putative uncharacterized protein DDB_G0286901 [Cydia amplana]|uniref:putative uncharacterized protein DDB_G0286901 n=1 Tax=Cydia amplana TaxID=1869771 RepID=UPI002FE65730
MSPLTLQHQTMNPLDPQPHNASPSPCYSCAMLGKPCVTNPAPSYLNVQPAVPMQNSQTGTCNGYRQNYNRNGSMPQNPGYNSDQISKAAYLAALRSEEYLQNATRDILCPPVPVNKKPRAPPKQRAKSVKKTKNVNANLAASPICNVPVNNGASTSTLPCCTPTQSYPLPNWAAFGIENTAPRKPTPKAKTAKVSNVKTQDNNIEIPQIELTTDVTQKSNTDMTPKIMPAPLSIETYNHTVNERIYTTQTNVTTTAYNMNAINLIQDPSNVEGQSKPMTMNINNNGTPTHLIEASTQQDTSSNGINHSQINTELPWIDIKSDGATIPLIMDQQDVSMENNELQTTTKTVTKNVQGESFLEQASDNIDIETAMALLHADIDEAPTNSTQNSTNAYELVSTTSVTTESTSHNIESNDIIMRTDISNSEVHTNREFNINQIIENTVTVSIVEKIITTQNISFKTETLLDILNKVHSKEEAKIGENMEQTRTEDANKIKTTHTAVDDGSTKGIEEDDDQTKDVPDSKDDDRFQTARQKLARWSAIEQDNKNKRADYNTQTDNNNQERCANKTKSSSAENASSSNSGQQNINSNPSSNNNDSNLENHSKKKKSISDDTIPELHKINATVVSKIMDDSDKAHKRQSKKRKSLSAEIAPTTTPGTNNTSDNIDDHNKNQDQHSKRRKSICSKTATITSRGAHNSKSTSKNNDDNDKNHERPSKKRKSTSGEVAPSKNQNRNSNVSENNDKDNEGHSKRRKTISAESETRANQNDCHNNCKNRERDCEARKNTCDQLTTPKDKDTATKNNEEHETRQPNASKNISDETATSKKTITPSTTDSSNSNKEPCSPDINHAANKKKDNNEVRKSIDSETTAKKDTGRLNVQDNASNKNKDNENNITRTCEATKSTSTDILSKKQTTTGSNATSTETATNNHIENQKLPPIILKIFRDRVESIIRNKNNGEKRHNSVNDEKASDKSAKTLNANEKDELPRVEIPASERPASSASMVRVARDCAVGV